MMFISLWLTIPTRSGNLVHVWVEVMLFLQRLEQDFDSLPPSMRKANSFQQATAKHQATGVFLHFLKEFEKVCPAGQFQAASESLLSQFKSGYLDCDLQHCLESQVPPADMAAISGFRTVLILKVWLFF